jgi:hypothetical protein
MPKITYNKEKVEEEVEEWEEEKEEGGAAIYTPLAERPRAVVTLEKGSKEMLVELQKLNKAIDAAEQDLEDASLVFTPEHDMIILEYLESGKSPKDLAEHEIFKGKKYYEAEIDLRKKYLLLSIEKKKLLGENTDTKRVNVSDPAPFTPLQDNEILSASKIPNGLLVYAVRNNSGRTFHDFQNRLVFLENQKKKAEAGIKEVCQQQRRNGGYFTNLVLSSGGASLPAGTSFQLLMDTATKEGFAAKNAGGFASLTAQRLLEKTVALDPTRGEYGTVKGWQARKGTKKPYHKEEDIDIFVKPIDSDALVMTSIEEVKKTVVEVEKPSVPVAKLPYIGQHIKWTAAEDNCLLKGLLMHGKKWSRIRDHYHNVFRENGRTGQSISSRAKLLNNEEFKMRKQNAERRKKRFQLINDVRVKGKQIPWTPEEDEALRKGRKKFPGKNKWSDIADFFHNVFLLNGRTNLSIRCRAKLLDDAEGYKAREDRARLREERTALTKATLDSLGGEKAIWSTEEADALLAGRDKYPCTTTLRWESILLDDEYRNIFHGCRSSRDLRDMSLRL